MCSSWKKCGRRLYRIEQLVLRCSDIGRSGWRVCGSLIVLVVLLANISGCGKTAGPVENLVPVSGTALLDGKPVEGIRVKFMPLGKTEARPGHGITDSDGHFEMHNYQNKEGLPQGKYVASFSLWLMPDGSPPPSGVRFAESGASEAIPAEWSKPSGASAKIAIADVSSNRGDSKEKTESGNMVTVREGGTTELLFNIPKKK